MDRTPATVAETYFRSWRDRDFETFADLLAEDVHFVGSMGEVRGRDACVQSIRQLREMLGDIRVMHRFVDGDDVLTWFELDVEGLDPIPVANWSHVEQGHITAIRVTFDPRSMLAQMGR